MTEFWHAADIYYIGGSPAMMKEFLRKADAEHPLRIRVTFKGEWFVEVSMDKDGDSYHASHDADSEDMAREMAEAIYKTAKKYSPHVEEVS